MEQLGFQVILFQLHFDAFKMSLVTFNHNEGKSEHVTVVAQLG